MYEDEKTQGFQRMILLVEIFVNVNILVFRPLLGCVKLWNEVKKMRKFYDILFPLVVYCF